MNAYRIKLNKKRCIACHACEVHCTVKNQTPAGLSLNRIEISGPKPGKDGGPEFAVKYQPCLHCKKPQCVDACPTGALYKRDSDGLVLLDADKCDGCKSCIEACPWSVPQFNPATGVIMKCDFCLDRIEQGLDPACVTSCTAKALEFVRVQKNA